jgi:hypothetical protein
MTSKLNKLKGLHSTGYLTLVSIVQGVIFGLLVSEVTGNIDQIDALGWLCLVNTFLVITITWNEYTIGVGFYEWVMDYKDSVLPFLIGLAQAGLVYFSFGDLTDWLLSMSLFCLLSLFAFINQYTKSKKEEVNRPLIEAFKNQINQSLLYIVLAILVFVGLSLASIFFRQAVIDLVFPIVSGLILVGFIALTMKRFKKGVAIIAEIDRNRITSVEVGMSGKSEMPMETRHNKLKALHSAGYLTLISIIQAVTFGLLVTGLIHNYQQLDATGWVLVANTFLVITIIWNEYIMGVSFYEWVMDYMDSLLPFLMGACQLVLVYFAFLELHRWLFAAGLFCLISFLSFLNQYRKGRGDRANHSFISRFKNHIVIAICYLAISAIFCMGLAISTLYIETPLIHLGIALSVGLTIVGFIYRATIYYRKAISILKEV